MGTQRAAFKRQCGCAPGKSTHDWRFTACFTDLFPKPLTGIGLSGITKRSLSITVTADPM
jgi:hypothetical protein